MALKCRGPGSPLNFGLEEYEELLPMLPNLSKVWSSIAICQLLHVCAICVVAAFMSLAATGMRLSCIVPAPCSRHRMHAYLPIRLLA